MTNQELDALIRARIFKAAGIVDSIDPFSQHYVYRMSKEEVDKLADDLLKMVQVERSARVDQVNRDHDVVEGEVVT